MPWRRIRVPTREHLVTIDVHNPAVTCEHDGASLEHLVDQPGIVVPGHHVQLDACRGQTLFGELDPALEVLEYRLGKEPLPIRRVVAHRLMLLGCRVKRVEAVHADCALQLLELLGRAGMALLSDNPSGVSAVFLDDRNEGLPDQVAAHDQDRALVVPRRVHELSPADVAAVHVGRVVETQGSVSVTPAQETTLHAGTGARVTTAPPASRN